MDDCIYKAHIQCSYSKDKKLPPLELAWMKYQQDKVGSKSKQQIISEDMTGIVHQNKVEFSGINKPYLFEKISDQESVSSHTDEEKELLEEEHHVLGASDDDYKRNNKEQTSDTLSSISDDMIIPENSENKKTKKN